MLIRFHLAPSPSVRVHKRILDTVTATVYLPADVGLLEVGSHADRLPIQLVGFLQTGIVRPNQVGQVDVDVQVVGGHAGRILLPRNDLARGFGKISRCICITMAKALSRLHLHTFCLYV